MTERTEADFKIQVVESEFKNFTPDRRYDAVLLQSCLEYVDSYQDIQWLRVALKPGGMAVATILCPDTQFYGAGIGDNRLSRENLYPRFAEIGMSVTGVIPLAGSASRICHRILHNNPAARLYMRASWRYEVLKKFKPFGPINRVANPLAAGLDRLMKQPHPIGHCVVLEPSVRS